MLHRGCSFSVSSHAQRTTINIAAPPPTKKKKLFIHATCEQELSLNDTLKHTLLVTTTEFKPASGTKVVASISQYTEQSQLNRSNASTLEFFMSSDTEAEIRAVGDTAYATHGRPAMALQKALKFNRLPIKEAR